MKITIYKCSKIPTLLHISNIHNFRSSVSLQLVKCRRLLTSRLAVRFGRYLQSCHLEFDKEAIFDCYRSKKACIGEGGVDF